MPVHKVTLSTRALRALAKRIEQLGGLEDAKLWCEDPFEDSTSGFHPHQKQVAHTRTRKDKDFGDAVHSVHICAHLRTSTDISRQGGCKAQASRSQPVGQVMESQAKSSKVAGCRVMRRVAVRTVRS